LKGPNANTTVQMLCCSAETDCHLLPLSGSVVDGSTQRLKPILSLHQSRVIALKRTRKREHPGVRRLARNIQAPQQWSAPRQDERYDHARRWKGTKTHQLAIVEAGFRSSVYNTRLQTA